MRTDNVDAELVATHVDSYQFNESPSSNNTTFGGETLLLLLSFSAIAAIAVVLFRKFSEKWDKKVETSSEKIPCPNCHFFSKSSYLRCAVRPKTTMTDDAIHCTDYHPTSK